MKDHKKRQLIEELVATARKYSQADQLRDRIAYALSGVFSELDEATARAERAEAELKAAREQKPVAEYEYYAGMKKPIFYPLPGCDLSEEGYVYAAPIPAQAAQVPQEWKSAVASLVSAFDAEFAEFSKILVDRGVTRLAITDKQAETLNKLNAVRALLQEVKP